ncbi:MAG TPA: DnaJ domain-containing protein [Noviherbaspirillum sp.]
MKTLYEVLGVDRQASITDIAQRYRHHLNQHVVNGHQRKISKRDQRRLQRMREAYLLLTSPSKRRAYDISLERTERARMRRMERAGIAACVVMLLAGGLLMVLGYLQVREKPSSEMVRAEKGGSAPVSGMWSMLAGFAQMKGSAQARD